jgi:predicted nucleic acid-binding protein
VQRVAVDANVFVSYLTGRHEKQYDAARGLLQEAEDGNLVAILPQFVMFEVTYVLQSLYNVSGDRLASMVRALVSFPGDDQNKQLERMVCTWPAKDKQVCRDWDTGKLVTGDMPAEHN